MSHAPSKGGNGRVGSGVLAERPGVFGANDARPPSARRADGYARITREGVGGQTLTLMLSSFAS